MSLNRVFSASLFPFISSNIDHNLFLFFQLNQQKRVYYHNDYYFLDKLPALPILALTFSTFILKLPMLSIIATVFPKSEDRYVFLRNQQMLFIYKSLKFSPNLGNVSIKVQVFDQITCYWFLQIYSTFFCCNSTSWAL